MFVIAETVDLCMPLLWARMIDVVARQGVNHESMRSLIFILSLVLVRTIFVWSLHGPARIIEQINSFKARVNYRRYLTKGVLSLPLEWHVDHHSGDTIDKINKGVNALGDFSEDSFIIIYCFVRFVVSFVMLSVFFPQ
jgi:ABC-type multidrug transport system fused ATPase/permease subunit